MFFTVRLRGRAVLSVLLAVLLVGGAVCVTVLAAEAERVKLPILMYHSLLQDEAMRGKYVISPRQLEEDLLYLKENGYHTVTVEELIKYTRRQGELPEKPVLLTFDDGCYNNYVYAYPLAKKYGMKLLFSPIGRFVDRDSRPGEKLSANYSQFTWEQMGEMAGSGLIEFGNHSYDLHHSDSSRLGVKRLPGESPENYRQVLFDDLNKMQEKMKAALGQEPKCFVYPFGAYSPETQDLLRELGFCVTLNCEEKINFISRDPECLFGLGRFLRTPERSAEELLTAVT